MTLGLTVLAVGLILGAFVVWRLARRGVGEAGRELERADLARRQEELYAGLRAARTAGDAEEVAELELQAAINLRDLEALGEPLPAGPPVSQPPRAAGRTLPAGVFGFVAGLAVAGLLVTLVFWAQRDARPRPAEPGGPVDGQDHPEGTDISAADQAQLDQLRTAVERDPQDLAARKRYALSLLGTGQFFAGFQQAQQILAARPDDPDGLYITAFVRLEMGQDETAVELFDRLLADYPQHAPALVGKGLAMARSGDAAAARALWLQALAASGGESPQIERLLAALDTQGTAEPVAGEPAPPATVAPAPAYTAIVRLAEGAEPPAAGVLFLALGGDAGGPPVAVRRIASPSFPIEVTLGAGDSMLGRPLPESGTLTARLDTDGNATTRHPEDLEAAAAARQTDTVELTLSRP